MRRDQGSGSGGVGNGICTECILFGMVARIRVCFQKRWKTSNVPMYAFYELSSTMVSFLAQACPRDHHPITHLVPAFTSPLLQAADYAIRRREWTVRVDRLTSSKRSSSRLTVHVL